jgi:hypothetical protein
MSLLQTRAQLADPAQEAGFELARAEQRKDAPKRVVRRNAVGKRQILPQPVQLEPSPFRYRRPALCTADHRTNRHQQQFFQLVLAFPSTWVTQFSKGFQQRCLRVSHLSLPKYKSKRLFFRVYNHLPGKPLATRGFMRLP